MRNGADALRVCSVFEKSEKNCQKSIDNTALKCYNNFVKIQPKFRFGLSAVIMVSNFAIICIAIISIILLVVKNGMNSAKSCA